MKPARTHRFVALICTHCARPLHLALGRKCEGAPA
jgi:hypothetical protein